ncbi:integrase [Breznakia sp. PF5-3]|uniref:site-specific integrase n=1 Tax=unclassified Breznakia TaxID=2623764 RepID=UPI0024053067|nr:MULTISPECIES: site-specific integrase [unclassified Breznakia]MDF9825475.1 integrase [Breznakia sp. PM6-1]MDF9836360.1 integrase [Breznakia sp. PF5-3]MDF9838934.1 integrase [Breznakia sp. PFB2-8]MDF9860958.1 integrase [Breznakia sp. PH5-24]
MPVYKDKSKGTWYASFYFKNWKGENEKKLKRGFQTKKAAKEWEQSFKAQKTLDFDMKFEDFIEIYKNDMKQRVKLSTWMTKEQIINKKVIPYFKNKKMNLIKTSDIIAWQNEMIGFKQKNGMPYSKCYLKTLHNQLSAIFNHAVRFYDLKQNPAKKAGNMGKNSRREMNVWSKDEYSRFSDSMMDKEISYHAFQMLYWCGIRLGEMLALTGQDFDFNKNTVSINKTYQRIGGVDYITSPKTEKSNRVVQMPSFLAEEMKDYIDKIYHLKKDQRVFHVSKSYIEREMRRGIKEQKLHYIRVHDLRHSHVSLLIEMGFSAVAIADRVGHESIEITYQYAHLFPTKQGDIANKLDSFMKEVII